MDNSHENKWIRLPELLSPAGDRECLTAAVENGADGVYFGLSEHNARLRARNFSIDELPDILSYLHLRGVKGYVTLNTLIFTGELEGVIPFIEKIISAGADAVLVQDIGLCRLIRKISQDFPIHASTQMTITNAAGVRIAKELGCSRIVMARECSLAEIKNIKQELGSECPELEVFVHGALCVAYSGQCLTSESLGGRSANRGECAQACRMPYELICDGKKLPLNEQKYLLSPKDIAALDLLPEIVELGIASVKIEGRLKSAEYVANVTRIYRKALDSILEKQLISNCGNGKITSKDEGIIYLTSDRAVFRNPNHTQASMFTSLPEWYCLQMAFSRGFYTGWLAGTNNQQLVHAEFGKKRGVYLGKVLSVSNKTVFIRLESALKPGDGVVFDCGKPELDEEGGRIYEIFKISDGKKLPVKTAEKGEYVGITFGKGDIDFNRIHSGDRVWKTSDQKLESLVRQSFTNPVFRYKKPLQITVSGVRGEPLVAVFKDEIGNVVEVKSEIPLVESVSQPLNMQILASQLGRLGSTQFYLREIRVNLGENLILPVSELNRIRREAIEKLEEIRRQPPKWKINRNIRIFELLPIRSEKQNITEPPQLTVLVRNPEQLSAVLDCGITTIYCDFDNLHNYDKASQLRDEFNFKTGKNIKLFFAPPRIFKDSETGILKKILASKPDGILARNFAHLEFYKELPCVLDFSFNIANPVALDEFLTRWNPLRATVSYDLNIEQIIHFLNHSDPRRLEITIHQHMPMFHMEYCLFCKFLSNGSNYTDCGRPCEKHTIKIRDRVGAEHPVIADAACRNTVYNSLAQTGAEFAEDLKRAGATWFRIEFLDEPQRIVSDTIKNYIALLNGQISGNELWKKLKLLNQIGVTRGQLSETDNKVLRKKEPVSWG